MKLLIVDDSNLIRSRIARISQHPGLPPFKVVGLARNGTEAVEMCMQHQPQMVTMDLTMPEMDGATCIEQLIRFNPRINILVISALNDKPTAIKAIKKGARGFLHKPFSDDQLINALLEMLLD